MSKDHHAEGQQDGARGEYNPPHDINIIDTLIQDKHTFDKLVEDNKQYDSGYDNARKQK
jgi:hypothetical protein